MVEGLSRSSRAILWASLLGMVALAWAALFGLQWAIGIAAPPAIGWLGNAVGPWGSYALLVGLIAACFYVGHRLERRRHATQYAADKTIHVERPNWWRQPLGPTRIPRLVWYYVGIFAVVILFGIVASLPR